MPPYQEKDAAIWNGIYWEIPEAFEVFYWE